MSTLTPTLDEASKTYVPGRVLNGRYRVLELLGEGGMGVVYRAEQLPLGREVALKVLRMRGGGDASFRQRFFLEASLTSQINHRNLVTVYDYGRIEDGDGDEAYFLALELLRGVTLHDRIELRGAIDASEAVAIAQGILRGLRVVHRQGIIHRDLKPANVMLVPDDDGREIAKVLDFGLVKQLATGGKPGAPAVTQAGAFLGTPEYMSPEHLDPHDVDERADLYAVGVILFEMLTGRPPFQGSRHLETLLAHMTNPVPALRKINPKTNASSDLEALVRTLLEKQRERRFASADAALQALAKLPEAVASPTSQDGSRAKDNDSIDVPVRYTVGRRLREEADSTWYEATQASVERPVDLQVFAGTNERSVARLRRSWTVLAALRHRSNPRVIDAGEGVFHGQRSAFVAYERARGESLADAIANGVRLATPRAAQIAADLLEALAEAHALGLVHGSIRPDVVVLQASDGRARLLEYELDYVAANSSASLKPIEPTTLQYVAPEILRGGRRTERADLYSIGAILYHCLAGQPPRGVVGGGGGPVEAVRAPALRPSGEVTDALARIVRRAIAEQPEERFDSAREFLNALNGARPRVTRVSKSSRNTLAGVHTVRWSQEPVSLWLLDTDPVFSRPMVRTTVEQLRQTVEVRVIPAEQREVMARLLREEKLVPPWVVLFGDMDVIVEDPLLAVLGGSGEVSRLLLSTHMNGEMLQRSVNFSGCDQQLALPVTAEDLYSAVERMLERTRGIREHYDRLRSAARDDTPEVES
ncbi:MAG: serine/threonine protein kinase [Myxococcales bacterium]|nr:serine/threonine protein kinase [Myxococcales bacterium]